MLRVAPINWQGWEDLNPRMAESESAALPLGDTPKAERFLTKLPKRVKLFINQKTHNIDIS